MGNGGPQHAQAGPLGWGLSYWASTTQAFSLLRPDPFVPGSILTAETGGARQPSSAQLSRWGSLAPYLLPSPGLWPFILAARFSRLQSNTRAACSGHTQCQARRVHTPCSSHGVAEHPLMAASLPLGWGHHCQGAKGLPLEWPLL